MIACFLSLLSKCNVATGLPSDATYSLSTYVIVAI
uniref:Uncharacterized protein n=1 Tax=Arundo donax TaxID=35708 RepID=A0A0A9FCF3_ARUDO